MIVLQRPPGGRPAREELLLAEHAASLGLGVIWLGRSELARRAELIARAQLCAGGVPWITEAMRLTGRKMPVHDPYPQNAHSFLSRRVWREAHLYAALERVAREDQPLFIKPAEGWKCFTGFVAEPGIQRLDPRFNGYSRRKPVWCSERLQIESEWRAYVVHDRVIHVARAPYSGVGSMHAPDLVRGCFDSLVQALRGMRDGYAMDVALTATWGGAAPKAVLLEVNDGFAVGAYSDIPASALFQLTQARWAQLGASVRA